MGYKKESKLHLAPPAFLYFGKEMNASMQVKEAHFLRISNKEYLCPGCAVTHLDVFLDVILLKEKNIEKKR